MIVLVHEFGHFLAFLWRGYDSISIRINPFMGTTSCAQEILGEDAVFIVLGGTVFNLTIAAICWFILHTTRSPYWIPLKLYSATSYLIEGMVILVGLFFQETVTDFSWLIELGWSPILVGLLGFIFIIIGGLLTYKIWIVSGINQKTSRRLILFLNGPFSVYCLVGLLIGQVILPIELSFFKKFMALSLVFHCLYMGLRIYFAPTLLPRIRNMMAMDIPAPTKNASRFSLILGSVAWVLSFMVLN